MTATKGPAAAAVIMERPGHQFLAGARLALDYDCKAVWVSRAMIR